MNFMASLPVASEPRVLPQNVDAEQAVLGTILMNNAAYARVAEFLLPHHFNEPLHRDIYAIAGTMIASGKTATPVTVKTFLGDHDLGGITATQYLFRLASESLPMMTVADFARLVVDLAARRDMIALGESMVSQAFDAPVGTSPADIAGAALTGLHTLAQAKGDRDTRRDAGAAAAAIIGRARGIHAGTVADDSIATGLPDLDRDTGGYQPGDLWIVAGRPGAGKSVLAGSLALKTARRGHGVMFFSMEMAERQMAARLLADMAYNARRPITFQSIMRGTHLDDEDMWRLDDVQGRMADLPLALDFASGLSCPEIAMRIRAEKQRMLRRNKSLSVVFIDYLDFIRSSGDFKGQKVHQVGEITQALKKMARNEEIAIVLLTQLNRSSQAREVKDKRPQLSDLRDSGNIEQDADVVAFIHRESYYTEKSPEYRAFDSAAVDLYATQKHQAELIIGKNRAGPTKTIELWCDMASSIMSAKNGREF